MEGSWRATAEPNQQPKREVGSQMLKATYLASGEPEGRHSVLAVFLGSAAAADEQAAAASLSPSESGSSARSNLARMELHNSWLLPSSQAVW